MTTKTEDIKIFPFLIFLLLLKAIFVTAIIFFAGIGLGPDEAQYWTWSKELSWGYYSKPPGIAWQIWLGTFLFGDTEFGVRFGSLVLGSFIPIAVYFLAKKAQLSDKVAFYAALIMAFTPLGFLATFFAITDVGVVLFWVLTFIPIISAMEQKKVPNYLAIGFFIALGALFKWQIYWIWLFFLPLLFLFPIWRTKQILLGIFVSLLGLLPSLYWNIQNEWATFRHVGATLSASGNASNRGNFLEFIGAQTALFSPFIFILIVAAFFDLQKAKPSLKFLGLSFFIIVILHCLISFFKKIQGNWCDYAYPAGFIFLSWYCLKSEFTLKLLKVGLLTSVLLTSLVFSLPVLSKKTAIPNPFKHNSGWEQIADILEKAGYDPDKDFLFASTYQTTSTLSFYGPNKKRAYFFNLEGIRKNQFSFWPQMHETKLTGKGYFIHIDKNNPNKNYLEKLQPYFSELKELGKFPILNNKYLYIIEGVDYNYKYPKFNNNLY